MKIVLIINFARSGGTVLTQLLNTFQGAWVLSEINTRAGATPEHKATKPELAVVQQAAEWFGVNIRHKDGLVEAIKELADAATSQRKTLVIRDWSYQNFRKTKQNNFQPSYQLELLEHLRATFDLTPFAFVRDSIDVFLSMHPALCEFGKDYNAYVKRIAGEGIEVLKYEELVTNPLQFEADLALLTGLDWKINFESYKASPATGDLQLRNRSRGIRSHQIRLLPRKRVSSRLIEEIESCTPLLESNRIFGYPEAYWNGNVEGLFGMAVRRGLDLLNRYI